MLDFNNSDQSRNQISGHLPESLYNLTNLNSLVLSHNNLGGFISPFLVRMSQLQVLYLSNNQIDFFPPVLIYFLPRVTELSMDVQVVNEQILASLQHVTSAYLNSQTVGQNNVPTYIYCTKLLITYPNGKLIRIGKGLVSQINL